MILDIRPAPPRLRFKSRDFNGVAVLSMSRFRSKGIVKQSHHCVKLSERAAMQEINPTGNGSSVIWTTEYEPPYSYLGKVMDKLRMKKQFEQAVDESVKNLKKLLER